MHATCTAAVIMIAQEEPIDSAMFYDARMGVSMYGGMFNPLTQLPFPTYYAFMAFNELYRLGTEVGYELTDSDGIYALAASNGKRGAIMLANPSENDVPLKLNFEGEIYECKVISETRNLSPMGYAKPTVIESGTTLLITVDL